MFDSVFRLSNMCLKQLGQVNFEVNFKDNYDHILFE